MNINITTEVEKDLLDKFNKELINKLNKAINLTTLQIEADAKLLCPVLTGFLRNSIHSVDSENLEGSVNVDAEYAAVVEFGLHNQRAQPYITPAIQKNKDTFLQNIKKVMNNDNND